MKEEIEKNKEGCQLDDTKTKSKEKMDVKSYLIGGMVAIILLVSILQSFQISSLKNQITTNAVQTGSVDTSGWTENEKMMYEHHGTLPSQLQSQQTKSQVADMVGGC